MSRPLLRTGSRGHDVSDLQGRLNSSKVRAGIGVDGIFGPRTKRAVEQFQRLERLSVDGIVGPCTWSALLGTDKYNIQHRITPVAQHTPATCWSAGTAMLLGRPQSIGPGSASLAAGGFLESGDKNMQAFADSLGVRLHMGASWSVSGLVTMIRRGPIMVCGFIPYGHCVVIGGIRGDGTPRGTTLTIYDPDGGRVYPEIYASVMRRFPQFTNHVLYK